MIEVDSGRVLLDLGKRLVVSAAFNPPGEFEGGRYLATNIEKSTDEGDCDVEIYDLETGEMMSSFSARDVGIQYCHLGISFDPAGRYLAGGSLDGWVWVLDLAEVVSGASAADAIVFNELAHTGIVPGPSITSDGILATSGADSMIRLWDINTDELILEFRSDLAERMARRPSHPKGATCSTPMPV